MTFTFEHSNELNRRGRLGGFTLVEAMVTLTLTVMIMAGLTESYLFMMKSTISLGNYADMNTQTRIGLEIFGRDIRMTTAVYTIDSDQILIEIPDSSGGGTNIRYSYDSSNNTMSRIQSGTGGGTQVILTDVQTFTLIYLTHDSTVTANPVAVKKVQLNLTMRRNVLTLENTNHVISAQYMMRNR